MREILILAIHLLVTLATLLRPGGVRAVAAESRLLKHQLLISKRSLQRTPNLTSVDRIVLGSVALFVRPHRLPKLVALKRRNPRFGCVRIAQSKDSLWSVDLLRCEPILLHSHRLLVVIDVFTRRVVGFAIERASIDGISVCRIFNHAVTGRPPPKHVSTGHDPLSRFHRGQRRCRGLFELPIAA